jgi:TolA-binding protein
MRASFIGTSLLLTVVLLAPGGCATKRDLERLADRNTVLEKKATFAESENLRLRADVEGLRTRLENALRANADSGSDLLSTKQRLNDMLAREDDLQHSMEEVRKELTASRTELYARLDDVKRAQSAAVAGAAAAAAPPIPADRSAHLTAIREAYAKRDWALVRLFAPEYAIRYPDQDGADFALYYAGDADLKDNRPASAVGNFNRFLKLFGTKSTVLDRALIGMGDAYLALHDCQNAKLAFQTCEKRFTKEPSGREARTRLASLAAPAAGVCAVP